MKKVGLAVVLVILIAGIGSPFFSGLMMERILRQSFEDINKMYADTGSDVKLAIVEYDRNFSSSKIKWKINLGSLEPFYGIDELIFVDRADHGFSSVTSTTSLEENRWFTDWVNKNLDGKNPLNIETRFEVLGNIKSTFSLDAFSLKDGDEIVEIFPGEIFIQVDKKFENASSQGSWEGMAVPEKFTMDNISFNSKNNKVSPYIWQGDASVLAKGFSFNDSGENVAVSNLECEYNVDFDRQDKLLSIGMGYGIGSIKSQQDDIQDGFVRFGINNIDALGYEDFVKTYSQMINSVMADIVNSSTNPDQVTEMMENKMAGIAPQLLAACEKFLKKGLEIRISDLRAQLPQGKIKGDISISLKKDMTIAQFIPIVMNPAAALDIFSVKSDISLPQVLLGDNQMLLEPLYPGMQTGLFVRQGDNLIHQAETRKEKLFVNQREVLLN